MCVYIYIYREREREREKNVTERDGDIERGEEDRGTVSDRVREIKRGIEGWRERMN